MPDEMPQHVYDPPSADHPVGRTLRTIWHSSTCPGCPTLSAADAPHLSSYLNSRSTPPEPTSTVRIVDLQKLDPKPPFVYASPTEMF
jgi:hypothetical protein